MSKKKQDEPEGGVLADGMNDTAAAEAQAPDNALDRLLTERDDLEAKVNDLSAQLAECQAAFDNPDRKQTRRKKEKRDALGVHDFWDGYEQALRDVAHNADGTQFVGRRGVTLSQALHEADVRRKAQVAEAEADAKAADQ